MGLRGGGPKQTRRRYALPKQRAGAPLAPALEESSLWNDLQDERAAVAAASRAYRAVEPMQELPPDEPWMAPDLERWERVVAFCETLHITSGADAGKRIRLRSWQRDFIKAVYSTDEQGRRLVRTAVLSMGRKNGKTQLAACLALCHLLGPEAENRGEIYSCANDRFQASKIHSEMVALIMAHPTMKLRVNILRFQKIIEDLQNGSLFVSLSAEAKTKLGLSPSMIVYDELGSAGDRNLYDALDSALGARKDPLMIVISTQAASDHAPLSRLIDYGERVNAGEINDPSFYLKLHTAPPDADPWALETWQAANPALGDFRSLEDVQRLAGQALRMPANESAFRNLILNQRVATESRFLERSEWNACSAAADIPLGARVFAALDLGATRDMSALVLVHQDANDEFHVKPEFWLPGDIRARSDEDHAPYEGWVREGYITPAGVSTDPKMIALRIAEISRDYRLITLAFDRWRMNDLKRELDAIGCDVQLVPHGQGFRDMSPAVDVVERLVVQRRLRHGGNPVLAMNVSNAVIARDPAGGRKLDKAKSTGRIDGLVALAMCLSVALIKTEPEVSIEAMIG